MSTKGPELFGWPVSPYTAKTHVQLTGKGVPFVDRTPTFPTLIFTVQRAVGRFIMPTMRLSDGTWVQDSSDLFDTIEEMHPTPSFLPASPRQRLASYLIELFADEWLPMAALHYRWNTPENAAFAIEEFGRYALPYTPKFLRNRLTASTATRLKGYLGPLGVQGEVVTAVEDTVAVLIAALNTHFANHTYLFGDGPGLADFSLYGPLWAHLYRDPGSRYLFDDAPHVVRWFRALQKPQKAYGDVLPNDEIPDTLNDLWPLIFEDQWSWIQTLIEHIDQYCEDNPDAHRVPRALGRAPFTIRSVSSERKLITFVQWKAQRPIDAYAKMTLPERASTNEWLQQVGGKRFQNTQVKNPFVRRDFKCVLANKASD